MPSFGFQEIEEIKIAATTWADFQARIQPNRPSSIIDYQSSDL